MLQVHTALHAFDMLQNREDIQKVNCSSPAFDKQFYDKIFVADKVESLLGVDTAKLDASPPAKTPTAPESASKSAPEVAPPEHKQAGHTPYCGMRIAL